MADSDTKPMLPEYTDSNAPPPYYMHQPQFQPQPQLQPYPQPYAQPQPSRKSNSTFVITQQPAPTMVTQVVNIPDHMGLAIFSCLCCFWPLGLAAIVMANQSREALGRGDLRAAQSNGRTSRVMSLISIGIGVLIMVAVSAIYATNIMRSSITVEPTYSSFDDNY